jgi:hypothetical protein
MPMPLRSVGPAGNRHLWLCAPDAAGGVLQTVSARSGKSAGDSRLRPVPGMRDGRAARPSRRQFSWRRPGARFAAGGIASQRRQRACGGYRPRWASWAEGGHSRAVRPGRPGYPARGVNAPTRGCVRPRPGGPPGKGAGTGRLGHPRQYPGPEIKIIAAPPWRARRPRQRRPPPPGTGSAAHAR